MKSANLAVAIVLVAASPPTARGGDLLPLAPGLHAADLYGGSSGSSGLTLAGDRLEALATAGPAPAAGLATAAGSASLGLAGDVGSYIVGRLGPLWFIEDLEDLDTGFNAEVGFGYRALPFLAFEIHSGYFWGEDDGTPDSELWGVPIVANVKLIIPILILEVYAGAGIGGYYIDTEASGGVAGVPQFDDEEEDIVVGGNAFVGAGFTLGPVGLGVEGKYIHTDDFDVAGGGHANLQGFAAMGYVYLSF
jgi:hypothetical protein